jgi:hypothetical protein
MSSPPPASCVARKVHRQYLYGSAISGRGASVARGLDAWHMRSEAGERGLTRLEGAAAYDHWSEAARPEVNFQERTGARSGW